MNRRDSRTARSGLALMPMIGILVLLTLLASLIAKKQMRGHRAFESLGRQVLARQIAAGEAQRIGLGLEAGSPVETGLRLIGPADLPGLPEAVAIEVTSIPGPQKRYRVEVRIPAGPGPNVVKESLEIP